MRAQNTAKLGAPSRDLVDALDWKAGSDVKYPGM
jgi:hypothetical protein